MGYSVCLYLARLISNTKKTDKIILQNISFCALQSSASDVSHHRWNRSTFLRTGAGTGLNKSDRTGPDRPVYRSDRSNGI